MRFGIATHGISSRFLCWAETITKPGKMQPRFLHAAVALYAARTFPEPCLRTVSCTPGMRPASMPAIKKSRDKREKQDEVHQPYLAHSRAADRFRRHVEHRLARRTQFRGRRP